MNRAEQNRASGNLATVYGTRPLDDSRSVFKYVISQGEYPGTVFSMTRLSPEEVSDALAAKARLSHALLDKNLIKHLAFSSGVAPSEYVDNGAAKLATQIRTKRGIDPVAHDSIDFLALQRCLESLYLEAERRRS